MMLIWFAVMGGIACYFYSCLVSGVTFLKGGRRVTRSADPVAYWMTMIACAGVIVFMLYMTGDMWRAATKR